MAKQGAPIGSKNAEKWTLDKANELIGKIYEFVETTQDCYSLGMACVEAGSYETQVYYLRDKFKDVEGFNFEPIKKALEICKNRIIRQGLKGEINNTMSIFVLKCNHDMIETSKVDVTTNGENVSIPPISWVKNNTEDGE